MPLWTRKITRMLLLSASVLLVACNESSSRPPKAAPPLTETPSSTTMTVEPSLSPTTTIEELIPEPVAPVATVPPEPILCEGYNHPLHHLSCDEANEATAAWRAPVAAASARTPVEPARAGQQGTQPTGGTLASIRACESGGDYGAVSPDGQYHGAYQFDQSTWESVGGSGSPSNASVAEQDQRAQMLYDSRKRAPWPNC